MLPVVGHAEAIATLRAAIDDGALHHAWLLTGPEGVGKATLAHAAALGLLAEAAMPGTLGPGLAVPDPHPTRALIDAGSHPDFRLLTRLPKDPEKPDEDLARSITIAQVRTLGALFATMPSLSSRRVVVIDAVDDLERAGANALLKNLEEPPAGTIFFLVSHSPGRLLPTIRSRCRVLRLGPLTQAETATVLARSLPAIDAAERAALAERAAGSPGRAARYAGLAIADLDTAIATLIDEGDRHNALRSSLARQLGGKAAQARYALFLERAVAAVATRARMATGPALAAALDVHAAARDLAGASIGLSLDPAATVFEMAGLIAGLARRAG